jgi:adenine-specific DNA-methyltransferase
MMTALRKADQNRLGVSSSLDAKRRGELGQFMTPSKVAAFMAAMFGPLPLSVRLLDAGAGMGALTAAFVQEACRRHANPRSIEVTAFEVDPLLKSHLKATLAACALECEAHQIEFRYQIVGDDYILHSSAPLLIDQAEYNCAILNPPYAKINSASAARAALRKVGIETSNLYTAFVALALAQLDVSGQLVAITPRSFCNGRYFDAFRCTLLDTAAIRDIHAYSSRRKTFADDDVLQENIIYRLVKGEVQPASVTITSSPGPDVPEVTRRSVPFSGVVDPNDPHRYIHLALSDEDSALAAKVRTLPCSLADLGIKVSTGRVVDFRAREHLRRDPEPGAMPLIYPTHFERGTVSWPKTNGRKHNALACNAATLDLFVPRGTYVLTKRFTSKEEKRRLVAVVLDPDKVPGDRIGFENHLNYFHEDGQGLTPALAIGLAAFLNSTAVDDYFRQFSGHTQVNATDLRGLHYPTRTQLIAIGNECVPATPSQILIDSIVMRLFS